MCVRNTVYMTIYYDKIIVSVSTYTNKSTHKQYILTYGNTVYTYNIIVGKTSKVIRIK